MPSAKQRRKLQHPALYFRDDSPVIWCTFTDERGRRRRKSTRRRDEKAAIAVWRRLERGAVGATDRPANEATLTATVKRYLEMKRDQGRAPDTIDAYTTKARHVVAFFGKDLYVSRIDAAGIDDFVAARKKAGASQHTIHKELVVVRGTLKVAARRKEYPGDPRTVMPIGFSTGYKPRETAHTPEQFAALLRELAPSHCAKLCFYVAVGPRRKELRLVRPGDVDFTTGFVRLRGTKNEGAARHVPITPLAKPLLERALGDADGDDEKLFMAWDSPYKTLARACVRAKVPYVTPNDLRRTFTTWLQEQGVSNEHLAKLLGHSSTAMVEKVYGRARPEALRKHLEGQVSAVSNLYRAGGDAVDSSDSLEAEISEETSRPSGARTRDQWIKSPSDPSTHSAAIIPLRAPTVSDLYQGRPAVRVKKCGPASLYKGVREPRNFGDLIDLATGLGRQRRGAS